MLFGRVVSFFLAFLTLGLLTFAEPVEKPGYRVIKRQSGVPDAIATLQSNVNQLLPQLKDSKDVPSASLIIGQIATQVTIAQGQLAAEKAANFTTRQDLDLDAIAQVLADIVQDVTDVLDGLVVTLGEIVTELVGVLDTALNDLFETIDTLLAGVLEIVAQLLQVVEGLLSEIVSVGLQLIGGLLSGILGAL